jgi:tRNA modification GTPase
MIQNNNDDIVAIASAKGRGGVGIVRVSGTDISSYMDGVLGKSINPRLAAYSKFLDSSGSTIDEGIALYFPAPSSFTGESVIEFHGHGGVVVLDALVARCVELGARVARPGEFSERAFLNDKIDLTQAEAIADLIDASTVDAARSAVRSMQGDFSLVVNQLVDDMIYIRMYVEAAIDFPEEEVDFLNDDLLLGKLNSLQQSLKDVLRLARQGSLLKDGITLVLAGKPNAGKSSLLNALSGNETAIVTSIAGTTRDVLRDQIVVNGLPVNIVDTAGLRESDDPIEKEGMARAWKEIELADRILFLVDSSVDKEYELKKVWPEFYQRFPESNQVVTLLLNKIDISGLQAGPYGKADNAFSISATNKDGIDALVEDLHHGAGFDSVFEGVFSARRRHLASLEAALKLVETGLNQLQEAGAGELLAEDLRQAQFQLSEITGQFTSDDLLGHIFSSFCIGK